MPPKNAAKGGGEKTSKKTDQKKKEKVIEDKTFGLKNKKGSKQQKFIQQVQKQVIHGGNKSAKQLEKEKEEGKGKKDLKKKEIMEINNLFKPVQQLVAKGVDPKSILCSYFKQGQCAKGTKCKFSHDLNIERKAEKRSAYCDVRDDKDTSENWDEETLKDVVEKKHGNEAANKPSTLIICRFFLDSVEEGKYGWFWECPNGEKCIYRHALPAGYVLKKERKKLDGTKEDISLEDLIERERAALGLNTTKVTLGTFLAWKKKKLKEREEKERKDQDKKKSDYKSGKEGGISGREMFIFNPDLAVGENMEEGDAYFDFKNMEREPPEEGEEEEEEEDDVDIRYKEIDLSALRSEYINMDVPNDTEADRLAHNPDKLANNIGGVTNGLPDGEETSSNCEGAVAIDEDLFDGDDEDLQDLEEQLEEMTVTS